MAGCIWEPLNLQSREIRLLELQSGKWEDGIVCTLAKADLDSKPRYCALSYVWGELTAPKTSVKLGYYNESKKADVWADDDEEKWVTINGHRHQVTLNLYNALRRLRAYGLSVPIWIDAVCIDQQNTDERTHQVGMMDDIYRGSDVTVISLGEIHPSPIRLTGLTAWHGRDRKMVMWHGQDNKPVIWYGDDRDLQFLRYFQDLFFQGAGNSGYSYGTEHKSDELFHVFSMLRLLAGDSHFEHIPFLGGQGRGAWATQLSRVLIHLKSTGWFHRTWTIQEAVLPRECVVQYGHMIAPWSMLSNAAVNYTRHQSSCCRTFDVGSLDYHFSCFVDLVRPVRELRQCMPYQQPQAKINLPFLLWTFRNRRATDHRDKVFALLGLVTDWNDQPPIRADYQLETPELYRSLVLDMINRTKSLSILEGDLKGDIREERHLDLPSWIPDWSDPVNEILFRQEHDRTGRAYLFNASGQAELTVKLKENNALAVSARLVDTVRQEGGSMSPAQGGLWEPLNVPVQDAWMPSPLSDDPLTGLVIRLQRRWRRRRDPQIAVWKCLCADSVAIPGANNQYQPAYRRLTDDDNDDIRQWGDLRFTRQVLPTNIPGAYWETVPYPNERVHALDKSSAAAVENSCFFVTHRHALMGLAPRATKTGDVIAILEGGRTPFVMRRVGDDARVKTGATARYELIGSCYVHGIMDGQVVRNPGATRSETVFIV